MTTVTFSPTPLLDAALLIDPKLALAVEVVREEHAGQIRGGLGLPHGVHLEEVAETLLRAGARRPVVIAGVFHDYIEDVREPRFGVARIVREFGSEPLDLVRHLTNEFTTERFPRMPRKRRKLLERARLAYAPADAKTIKLADVASNAKTIEKKCPKFARVYLAEAEALVPVLRVVGDAVNAAVLVETLAAVRALAGRLAGKISVTGRRDVYLLA